MLRVEGNSHHSWQDKFIVGDKTSRLKRIEKDFEIIMRVAIRSRQDEPKIQPSMGVNGPKFLDP